MMCQPHEFFLSTWFDLLHLLNRNLVFRLSYPSFLLLRCQYTSAFIILLIMQLLFSLRCHRNMTFRVLILCVITQASLTIPRLSPFCFLSSAETPKIHRDVLIYVFCRGALHLSYTCVHASAAYNQGKTLLTLFLYPYNITRRKIYFPFNLI